MIQCGRAAAVGLNWECQKVFRLASMAFWGSFPCWKESAVTVHADLRIGAETDATARISKHTEKSDKKVDIVNVSQQGQVVDRKVPTRNHRLVLRSTSLYASSQAVNKLTTAPPKTLRNSYARQLIA